MTTPEEGVEDLLEVRAAALRQELLERRDEALAEVLTLHAVLLDHWEHASPALRRMLRESLQKEAPEVPSPPRAPPREYLREYLLSSCPIRAVVLLDSCPEGRDCLEEVLQEEVRAGTVRLDAGGILQRIDGESLPDGHPLSLPELVLEYVEENAGCTQYGIRKWLEGVGKRLSAAAVSHLLQTLGHEGRVIPTFNEERGHTEYSRGYPPGRVSSPCPSHSNSPPLSEDRLDVIYQEIDVLLRRGAFPLVDAILATVDTTWPVVYLLAYVSVTHAAREHLQNWAPLLRRVREHLSRVEPDRVEELLRGFE